MQDRRLQFDDNRGLGQGVLDNRPVLNMFRILLENVEKCTTPHTEHPAGALTVVAHGELQTLLHPMEKLIWYETEWIGVRGSFGDDHEPMDVDMQLAVVRSLPHIVGSMPLPNVHQKRALKKATLNSTATGVVVHRTHLRSCDSDVDRSGTVSSTRVRNWHLHIQLCLYHSTAERAKVVWTNRGSRHS